MHNRIAAARSVTFSAALFAAARSSVRSDAPLSSSISRPPFPELKSTPRPGNEAPPLAPPSTATKSLLFCSSLARNGIYTDSLDPDDEVPTQSAAPAATPEITTHEEVTNGNTASTPKAAANGEIAAQTYTFRELASATKNFRPDNLLGEGGFGRVYKGTLGDGGQLVAVKQLDRSGVQGHEEFFVEVLMLSLLHHQNLVSLIGYCADGTQRLLVYEFMPLGSVEDHLFDIGPDEEPLTWYSRIKIAVGAAKGLEYLHEKANPPIIFRDLKSSNILLDENCNAKLSDFGLAKLGPVGDQLHGPSRIMGTYGYCAPEYASTGELTLKSDVYSFGVVLLELVTGRRALDTTKPMNEQNLVAWAQPMFKDQRNYCKLADPLLGEDYPERDLNQAIAVAAMCVQEEAAARPFMCDVVVALGHLTAATAAVDAPCQSNQSNPMRPDERELYHKRDLSRERAVAEAMEWGSAFKAEV
ncbi:hypothetical protein ZIOFF_026715 [Zingiber officinale]|uniref:Protein kinase domain-containing protein n=1 Tax=Zingiber officinale TaxID=94328 RepID=A0A8J5HGY7_ZINOF|nr:hypothetical protein ZIOFF_026715 [Zingiber officinale]